MRTRWIVLAPVALAAAASCANWLPAATKASAQAPASLNCSLNGYKAAAGLNAALAGEAVTFTWDGDKDQELRLRFVINNGTPTIQELAVRRKGADWAALATNVTPEYRVASGRRRMDHEAREGLEENGIHEITPAVFEKYQWDPFWDAPLNVPGGQPNDRRTLGLPRKADEIHRATATYQAQGCDVKTDGTRLTVAFPGVTLGVFAGELQFTVYKGSNLIRQEVIAKTEQNSVAYKYDAGLKGLAIGEGSRMVWRDPANMPQSYSFGGARNEHETPVRTANRLMIAERGKAGSIAAFPPPHNFFWARESSINLGYNWYRKDGDSAFSFGVRQAEKEESPNNAGNFALYSARPGRSSTWRCFTTRAPRRRNRRARRCSRSRMTTITSRSTATRRWSITSTCAWACACRRRAPPTRTSPISRRCARSASIS